MKKLLALLLTLTLTLSMSLCAFAASDKSNNGKGNGSNKSESQATSTSGSDVTVTSETSALWTNKTGNLVKLYTDDGKKVMFPVQALMNNGATKVDWDTEAGTVTVTGTNKVTVVFTPNSTTATTQVPVALGDTTDALQFTLDTPTDPTVPSTTGIINGDILITITDPLTGNLIDVTLTIEGTFNNYEEATGYGEIVDGTISGVYADQPISGTITGTLSDPVYDLNEDFVNFAIPFTNEISNGRAYVPIQDLDRLFGTELVTESPAAGEPATDTEIPVV